MVSSVKDEQLKEAQALLKLSRVALWEAPPHELCDQAVKILPEAFSHAEEICVRVMAERTEHLSQNFEQTPWEISSDLKCNGERIGVLTVCRLSRPQNQVDLFSTEEESVVEQAAAILSKAFEHDHRLQRLQAARDYAENIVESVRDPLLVLDGDLRAQKSNHSFQRAFGVSDKDSRGRRLNEIGDGRFDIPELHNLLRNYAGGTISLDDYELEYDEEEGRRTLLLNARWVRHQNRDGLILLTIEDITERKRKMQLLSGIIENSETPVYVKDTEGRYLLANRYYEDVLVGLTPEEIIGKTVYDIFPHDIAAELREHERRVVETGQVQKLEEVAIDKFGNHHTFMSVKFPLLDTEGKPYGFAGIATEITKQKETAELVERQRYEYETIFNSMPAWIWYKDRNSVVVRANKAACNASGMTPEEIIGKTTQELYPQNGDAYVADDREVMETGEPKLNIIEKLTLPGGKTRWVRTDKIPYCDPAGNIIGIIAVSIDIDEQKRAQQELQHQQREYETIFNSVPTMIWYKDRHSVVVKANKAAATVANMTMNEVVGKPTHVLYPEQGPHYEAEDQEVMRSGQPLLGLIDPFTLRSGRKGWIRADKVPYRDETGRVIGVIVFANDITEQVQAEEALRESRQRLQAILDNTTAMIYVKDCEGRYLVANTALLKQYGVDEEDIIGELDHHIFPKDLAHAYRENDEAVLKSGEPRTFEEEYLSPAGKRINLASKVPLRDAQGNVYAVCSIATDITEKKRTEHLLREFAENVVERVPALVVTFDKQMRIQRLNKYTEDTVGYTRDEVQTADWLKTFTLPNEREEIIASIQRILNGETTLGRENTVIDKQGNQIVVRWYGTPLRDGENHVAGALVMGVDITEIRRKESQIESARQEAEADRRRLRTVLDALPVGVLVVDAAGKVIDSNKALAESLGMPGPPLPEDPADYAPLRAWWTATGERVKLEDWPIFRAIRKGEEFSQEEIDIVGFDDARRTLLVSGAPVRSPAGDIIGGVAIALDITERKQLTIELEHGTSLLSALLDSIPDLVFFKDRNGVYLGCNPAFTDFVGRPREEIIGRTDYDFFPKEQAEYFRNNDRLMLEQETPRSNEELLILANGKQILVETVKAPLCDASGNVIGLVGVSRDITQRKEAEEKLRKSEASLAEAQRIAHVGSWEWRIPADEVVWSEETHRILGKPLEKRDLDQKAYLNTVHPDDQKRVKDALSKTLREGTPYEIEHRFLRSDGSERIVYVRGELTRDDWGNPLRLAGTVQDITERKEAEDKLRKSQARLTEAQQIAHIGNWDWTIETDVLFWSDETYKIFGRSPDDLELDYETYLGLIHPEDVERVKNVIEQALRGQPSYEVEHRTILPDGYVRTVYCQGKVTYNDEGKPTRIAGTIQDITERKQITQDLEQRTALLTGVMNSIPDIVFFKDRDGVLLGGNPQFEQLIGKPIEQIIGKTDQDLFPEELADFFRQQDSKLIAEKQPRRNEEQVQYPDGHTALLDTLKAPLYDANGDVTGLLGISRDITERKEAEEKLRQSESRLAEAQRIAHIGSWEWNIETDEVIWSDETYRIFCQSPEEFLNTYAAYLALVHPDDAERVDATIARSLEEDVPYEIEHRLLLLDGTERIVYGRGEVTRNDQGTPVRMAGTVQDITERKLLQIQLSQAAKMEAIGRLAGGVAHDFNNYLTAIRGYTTLMSLDVPSDSDLQEDLNEVIKATNHAAQLTMQLLAFGRRAVLKPEPLNINHVIDNMAGALRRVLREDIELHIHQGMELPNLYADPGQIQQVILNLIINARDAMPTGGDIAISTRRVEINAEAAKRHNIEPGTYVQLSVSDTGTGMDQETLQHIFEPFFTTKVTGEGTGLGLATVHGIVTQSGGFISVNSAVGEGTTFTIYFPAVEAKEAATEAEAEEEMCAGGQECILVVEDEEAVRSFVVKILQKFNFTILEARDPNEAITIAREHEGTIDLLLSDVIMPEMNGLQLAARLKTDRPDLPVLFISGYTKDAIPDRNIAEADIELLTKPFTIEELCTRIRRILDAAKK